MRKCPPALLNLGISVALLFSWIGVSPVYASPEKQVGPPIGAAPGVLIVGYRKSIKSSLQSLPGKLSAPSSNQYLELINAVRIEVPPENEESVRRELLKNPDVLYVEPDYPIHSELIPNDPRWPEQYGPANIRATDAWEISTGSKDITIAVIDSGIDLSHPEFKGRLATGYSFIEGDPSLQDLCGHGTHVAGIAAASGNNHIGVAGINWQAKIMPVRVLGPTCSGNESGLANGIIYAVEHGVKVINLSLGFDGGGYSKLVDTALEYAYRRGVSIFAAAGNSGGSGTTFPASSPWVMAVGAVDEANLKTYFSNSSNQSNQKMVMAPGLNILSTTPQGYFFDEVIYHTSRNYGLMSGTSMATPYVSGAAALLAGLPGFDTPDKIYQALYKTALDLSSSGWDNATGYGLIQIDLAMGFTDFTPPTESTTPVVYDLVTSTDCQNVQYSWVDATVGGDPILLDSADSKMTIPLPFEFQFGGQGYQKISISANGYIIFGEDSSSYSDKKNYPIPWASPPNNYAAPFWADLSNSVGGQIFTKNLGSSFVIEWWSVSYQGNLLDKSELTFEIILYRNSNHILFQYHTLRGMESNNNAATVGIENAEGKGGVQYSFDQKGVLKPGLALLFVPGDRNSTRIVAGCIFSSQTQYRGCNQLDPFGADIFDGLLPSVPPYTIFSIERVGNVGINQWPGDTVSVGQYARFSLNPVPITPYSPAPMVCYQYSLSDILKAGGHAENLFIASYDPVKHTWIKLPTAVDLEMSSLMAVVDHFSVFGIFARKPKALPVTGSFLPEPLIGILTGMAALFAIGFLLVWLKKRRGSG